MIVIGNNQCTFYWNCLKAFIYRNRKKHFENDSPFTLNSFEITIPQSSNLPAECLIGRINQLVNSYHQVTWKIVHGKYRAGYLCGFEYCWQMGSVLLCMVGLESEVQRVANGSFVWAASRSCEGWLKGAKSWMLLEFNFWNRIE